MMQFMQGRYGADQMGQMLSAVSMVFLIISLFSRNQAWFLLAVIGIVYNYFSDVFQKYFKALRGKPEISEDDGWNPEKACFLEIPACTAQNLPYLQMPWLQTENPCAQGARQNRNPLS